MKKYILMVSMVLTSFLFFSCQPSSKEDLKDAQLCLNSSAPADARGCLNKISSDTSAAAYKLRCSAVFISEGFNTPATFSDALDKLKNPGTCTGGCSSTVGAINALNFHAGANLGSEATARARNLTVSSEAFSYCSQSQTGIYLQISSLFRLGTIVAMAAYQANGSGTPTDDQIKAQISGLDSATLGSIVNLTYSSSCQNLTTTSDSTKAYCTELGKAVSSGTTDVAVGNCLKIKLQNPASACP